MQDGKITSFAALIFIAIAIFYGISRARKQLPSIRRIAGLDAIEEAIGRATETGKPVFYTTGMADITGDYAAVTFAALEILGYATRIVARNKADMTVGISQPNVYPLALQMVEEGYLQGGNRDLFNPEKVQFFSPTQWAYASSCMGFIQREKAAATLMLGHFMAEAMLVAEASSQAGAISISGMTSMAQLPFLVAACDYTLIGDEMLVAGAYLAQDPVKLGSTAGQDWVKLAGVCLILVGAILATFGSNSLAKLLSL
ncbi:MAG: hypothetical protein KBI40_06355 [Firmicutes bacterium]|nr:hypothetical protein [Candidatus Fermentithermobacillaceae bacterium]